MFNLYILFFLLRRVVNEYGSCKNFCRVGCVCFRGFSRSIFGKWFVCFLIGGYGRN